ncbi:separase [Entomortierella parvispora]|uniref:separase n=1 Tax=Entomortierella parvispora TaxID=205924 RepID=A0A9P3HJI5_9FUNG|nr:separase [Entomortierella parvispora]
MATQRDPLDVIIDSLADPRHYHDNLVEDVKRLLDPNRQERGDSSSRGKQIKRLVNMCMSTLTQWSKVHENAASAPPTTKTPSPEKSVQTTSATKAASVDAGATKIAARPRVARATSRTDQALPAPSTSAVLAKIRLAPRTRGSSGSDRATMNFTGSKKALASRPSSSASTQGNLTQKQKDLGVASSAGLSTEAPSPNVPQLPCYDHIPKLVEISFLAVGTLEAMDDSVSTGLFDIEKARSNLITKTIEIGMKKRAFEELGFLRDRLLQSAQIIWGEADLVAKDEEVKNNVRRGQRGSVGEDLDSPITAYRDLLRFPFPHALKSGNPKLSEVARSASCADPVQTFVLLVLALHNNAVRCWIDARNGALAHYLHEMMQQRDSPLDWCMYLAKIQPQAAHRPLDALFRLLFIAAGKVVEANRSSEGHRQAFLLRILAMRYFATFSNASGIINGTVWEKLLRCGVECDKETKDDKNPQDGAVIVQEYTSIFEFIRGQWRVDLKNPCFQSWCDHFAYLARKTKDITAAQFVQSIRSPQDDCDMKDPEPLLNNSSSEYSRNLPTSTISVSAPSPPSSLGDNVVPVDAQASEKVVACLDEAVKTLRKYEECLQDWLSQSRTASELETCVENTKTVLTSLEQSLSAFPKEQIALATLQNIARIFRSMDTLRTIGSKGMDSYEKIACSKAVASRDDLCPTSQSQIGATKYVQLLQSIEPVLELLSDVTAGLWRQGHTSYLSWYTSDPKSCPSPVKLSGARVDALLLLFRLLSHLTLRPRYVAPSNILTLLDSAVVIAKEMGDYESLPYISNAMYNYGGSLFKAGNQIAAIGPLEFSISAYRDWICKDDPHDKAATSDDRPQSGDQVKARTALANRYEVLGVCFLAVDKPNRAVESFNAGLCVLPLKELRLVDGLTLDDMRNPTTLIAKLLNRRARAILTKEGSRFESVVTSAPTFMDKMAQPCMPLFYRGAIQEFECGLLSILGIKASRIGQRNQEQIEILTHLRKHVFVGGRALAHPVRRARVLIQLAALSQANPDRTIQQEAMGYVDEAIDILKERDLKADSELVHVLNHNLAMAYTWYGILDRNRDDGLRRKSKPFQIALKLWEIILSEVECFYSVQDANVPDHRAKVEKVLVKIPDPEFLYEHLQMLADCLGVIDYKIMQVQIHWLMLRLCNGVLPVSEATCLDAARIYSRMAQGYLALGYTGKAKAALGHSRRILDEIRRISERPTALESEVGVTWSLSRSLYLMAIGRRAEGVEVFNYARKDMSEFERRAASEHQSGKTNTSDRNSKGGLLSRKADMMARKTLALAEASLARSRLLHGEGNVSEAILDAIRAVRQLSSIIATVSAAVEAAHRDKDIIAHQPMENPFLDPEEPTDRTKQHSEDESQSETRKLRQGLENLASLRYQWPVFRLLVDAYHQLASLYLIQGCAREAQYFREEGKHIALLSKAGKSVDQFTLDHVEFCIREHEWQESELLLKELILKEQETASGTSKALVWEIQDAKVRMVQGDLRMAMGVNDLAVKDYFKTDGVLTHLMDKKFISALEELVIREPQTPREKKMVQIYDRRPVSANLNLSRIRSDIGLPLLSSMTPDQGDLECLALSEMKASLGYRMGLLMGEMGEPGAMDMVEKARKQDPVALTSAEYHTAMAKLLMMYLKDLMSVHVVYHMLPESVLSVGLLEKTPIPSASMHASRAFLFPDAQDLSPSVRMTKTARRRSARQAALLSPVANGLRESSGVEVAQSSDKFLEVIYEAKSHLKQAYRLSLDTNPPHVVADICTWQSQLDLMESSILLETKSLGGPWAAAINAAFNLEMAKAITQRREMRGLIKHKLNPALSRGDQSWPQDICPSKLLKAPTTGLHRPDNFGGHILQKPRPLNMRLLKASDSAELMDLDMSEVDETNFDILEVGMKPSDLQTRRGKREFLSRHDALRPSTSKGNERPLLEILDDAYARDASLEERRGGFQEEVVDIIPSNWVVVSMSMDVENDCLLVTRLRAKAMPIVIRLPLNRIMLRESDESNLGLNNPNGGDSVHYLSFKEAYDELQDILKESQETLSVTSSVSGNGKQHESTQNPELTLQEKAEWWSRRQHLNDRLRQLLDSMEDQWLCGLKGLIQSHNTPAQEKNLWAFKSSLEAIMFEAVKTQSSSDFHLEINIDLCAVFLNLGDKPSLTEIKDIIYLLMDAYLLKGTACSSPDSSPMQSSVEYTEGKFEWIASRIDEAIRQYWEVEAAAHNGGFDDGAHVILILDKHLQVFPWESCPVLRDEAVSRMPSIWMLRDRILQQRHAIGSSMGGSQWQRQIDMDPTALTLSVPWKDVEVDPKKTFYVLNPGGDLKNTEAEFKEYVESQQGWEGVIGREPMSLECERGLSQHELYVYFGHSGGEQYIRSQQIRGVGNCAVALLLGCSSGSLKGKGEFDPSGSVIHYLLAGSPTLVANLWDVTDRDLDRFSKSMFTLWGLDSNRDGRATNEVEQARSSSLSAANSTIAGGIVADVPMQGPLRLSLVEAVKGARDTCRLKYLVGAASVVYGIPCFLKAGQ